MIASTIADSESASFDSSDQVRADQNAAAKPRCRRPIDYILLKLAARCNIACDYCYWFRDESVLKKPPTLTTDAEDALIHRLRLHIEKYSLSKFAVLFHGGEPLLFGPNRFARLCQRLRTLDVETGCRFKLDVTTNGLLINDAWVELFRNYQVGVTLSIDGPGEVHDAHRVDFSHRGTYLRVIAALNTLRAGGIQPGVLAVCTPDRDPRDLLATFVDELDIKGFDILIPDANHEDNPPSIAPYYKRLFDLWLSDYAPRGVRIRIIENMLLGLMGGETRSETLGYGPVDRVTILTDGSIEALDILRIAGNGSTASGLNLVTHELQEIERDPVWRSALDASLTLAAACVNCVYSRACGGGHIASRWSSLRQYDNPSVYCADLKAMFEHAWATIRPTLYVEPRSGATVPL